MFIKKLPLCLLICLGGGWLMGWLTNSDVTNWYPQLIKAYGTPPSIVFPIVWTILYFFMAIALALLWSSKTKRKEKALIYFTAQLVFNFAWSWIFFHFHQIGLAVIDIILLWIFILLTIRAFWPHTRWGSYLLMPYLAWVTYALYLNLAIWILN